MIFANEDFNGDGILQMNEAFNAMIRSDMPEDQMKMGYEGLMKYGNENGDLTFEQYEEMIEAFMEWER